MNSSGNEVIQLHIRTLTNALVSLESLDMSAPSAAIREDDKSKI